MENTVSKTGRYNKDYYLKNKERLSEKKKARYRNDPSYREGVMARQAQRRRAMPRRSEASEQVLERVVDGMLRRVFRIGDVAKKIGKSVQTIRGWEKAKIIPHPLTSSDATHRYYTEEQVAMLGELADIVDKLRYCRGTTLRADTINKKAMEIAEKWSM